MKKKKNKKIQKKIRKKKLFYRQVHNHALKD
jgi:hypothetical protein